MAVCSYVFTTSKKQKHFWYGIKIGNIGNNIQLEMFFRAVFFPHSFSTTFTNRPRLYTYAFLVLPWQRMF